MGQYRETALASGDVAMLKKDIIADLMQGWDHWSDMRDGASPTDRRNAEEEYAKAGLDPTSAGDDYDKALREEFAERSE